MIVCDNITNAWSGLKFGIEKDKYVGQNAIEVVVMSSSGPKSLQATKSCLGMNKRTIQRAFRQRKLLDSQEVGHKWVKRDRKSRRDGMTQTLQDLVFNWWLEDT